MNKERSKILLDQPQTIAAFEWVVDNIYKYRVMPKPGELTRAPGQTDDFMTGKVALMLAGTWRLSDYVLLQDFQWDMTHVPLSPGTKKRGTTFNDTPAVSASPIPPDVLTTTSCAPATFGIAPAVFPPAHPVSRPSA